MAENGTVYSNYSQVAPREDQVYMAKLAEQAERYDGKFFLETI